MKIEKVKDKSRRSVTLRIDNQVMNQIDDLAKDKELSRQRLIEEILKKALSMKNFKIEVKI